MRRGIAILGLFSLVLPSVSAQTFGQSLASVFGIVFEMMSWQWARSIPGGEDIVVRGSLAIILFILLLNTVNKLTVMKGAKNAPRQVMLISLLLSGLIVFFTPQFMINIFKGLLILVLPLLLAGGLGYWIWKAKVFQEFNLIKGAIALMGLALIGTLLNFSQPYIASIAGNNQTIADIVNIVAAGVSLVMVAILVYAISKIPGLRNSISNRSNGSGSNNGGGSNSSSNPPNTPPNNPPPNRLSPAAQARAQQMQANFASVNDDLQKIVDAINKLGGGRI